MTEVSGNSKYLPEKVMTNIDIDVQCVHRNFLQWFREQVGLTRAELARAARVSERTLSDIEKGRKSGRTETRNKIVNALNTLSKREPPFLVEEIFPPDQY